MTGDRLYAAVLRLYPRAFQREYGAEALDAFRQMQRVHGETRLAFAALVAADLARSLYEAHADEWQARRSFAVEWTIACAAGAAIAALLTESLTWSVAYFYHPYLEGLVVAPWAYGALLGIGLGAAQAVVLRPRLRVRVSWIAATAVSAALGLQGITLVTSPAPVTYALALGLAVGVTQWALLRTRFGSSTRWTAASAVAIFVALIACAATMPAMFGGVAHMTAAGPRALSFSSPPRTADFLLTVISGVVVAAFTVRSAGVRRAHHEKA